MGKVIRLSDYRKNKSNIKTFEDLIQRLRQLHSATQELRSEVKKHSRS